MRRPARPTRPEAAAALAVGVFLLGLGAVVLAPGGGRVAAWWPAAGLSVGALSVAPRAQRRELLLVVLLASAAANLVGGRSLPVSLGFAVGNALEAAVASQLLRRGDGPRLDVPQDLWRLVCSACLGGAAVATVASTVVWLDGGPVWATWRSVAAAHSAAVLLLVPLALHRQAGPVVPARLEQVGQWVAVLVVPVLVFCPGQHLPLTFLVLPPLLWAAARSGVGRVAGQLVGVFVLVSLLTAAGTGPFAAAADPQTTGLLVQLLMASTSCVSLALALSVAGQRAALRALADRKEFDEAVLEAVQVGVLACDAEGAVVVRNRAHRQLVGLGDDEQQVPTAALAGRLALHDAGGLPLPNDRWPMPRAARGERFEDEVLRVGPPGTPVADLPHLRTSGRQIRSADGTPLGAVVCLTDVSEEHRVQAELREGAAFHDAVLAATPDLVFVLDVRTNATVWSSRTMLDLLGLTPEHVNGLGEGAVAALVHPDDVARLLAANMAVQGLPDGRVVQIRHRVRHSDGDYRTVSRRVTPFARDETGAVTQVLGVTRDISDAVETERRLAEAALHDALTGLPNRRLLADRLRLALARTARTGSDVAVLFCDLDGFKQVNDTGGHAAGDAVLVEAARRLRDTLRPQDTVARVGGDEFVVLLENDDQDAVLDAAQLVAERLTAAVGAPVEVGRSRYRVTVSVGITFGRAGDDPDHVLRDADAAMYRAKAAGKDRAVVGSRTAR